MAGQTARFRIAFGIRSARDPIDGPLIDVKKAHRLWCEEGLTESNLRERHPSSRLKA
jgi:hypothetical protein